MKDDRPERPRRPQSGGGAGRGASPRPQSSAAETLLEMADELEAQGRELITQSRQLQRLAQQLGGGPRRSEGQRGGGTSRPAGGGSSRGGGRGEGRGSGGSGERGRGRRPVREDEHEGVQGGSDRPKRRGGPASKGGGRPEWTPERKKRKKPE